MIKNKNFPEIILIFLKWRKSFIAMFVIVLISSVIISFLLPKWYKASAKIIIPSKTESGLNISAILGNVPIDLGGQPTRELARLETIINSRRLLNSVIKKYDLQKVYGKKYLFKTRDVLRDKIDIQLNFDDSSILLSFAYKNDPGKAAEICRFMLEKANLINIDLQNAEAKNNRIYIEKLYKDALSKMEMLEDSLKNFQKKYSTYELDEQLKATIEAQAMLEGQLMQVQTQYAILKKMLNPTASQLKNLELRISMLKQELDNFQTSKSKYSVFIPLKDIPDQGIKYYKLKKEIQILSKVLEFLTPQYQQAKIQESQSKPSFIVLDYPEVPEYKFKPKRAYIVLGATFASILFLFIYIWIWESFLNLKKQEPSKYEKYRQILNLLRFK